MNRFDRITAILIQLQSRKIVKAQDLAERFEISLRTVYRDMNTLAEAGVPIIGEAGVGYSIMEGYRLPPVMFTKEEARTFITAEKLMEKFTDSSTKMHHQSAMFKIKSVLKSADKNLLENMEQHIEVRHQREAFNPTLNNTLEILLKGISERKVIRLHYSAFNTDDITSREIEPIGLYHENNYWYVVAFCLLRDGYRNFRCDRMSKIELTETAFSKQHASLKEHLDSIPKLENLQLVVLRVKKQILRYIQEQKYYYGFVSEKRIGDEYEITFLSNSLDVFARWFVMFAEFAVIVQPANLSDLVKKRLNFVLNNLKDSPNTTDIPLS